jgi:hypothetical protein
VTAPISVRGGANGIEAHCEDMHATARLFGVCASDTADQALRLHGYLVRPELAESAVVDPVGAARFEGTLLAALDGPGGVALLAAATGAIDVGLRVAADAYLGADRLSEALAPAVGFLQELPGAQWDAVSTLVTGGNLARAGERWLSDDPYAADLAGRAAATGFGVGSMAGGAALLGRLYPDGQPKVTPLGRGAKVTAPGPPRSLADLMTGLAMRNDGLPGEVDVRILATRGSAARHVIVDVPGTKDWSPARSNMDITSLATNLRALAGTSTSYERGILTAMREAGVRSFDDVTMVGHSEGGMVAVSAAIHTARSGEFRISHVVTAGAPIGATVSKVPRSVDVLAIENDGDVVPHLDATQNEDRVNVTTVTVSRDHGTVGGNHALDESYVPGAADIDASSNGSTRTYLEGLRPFLTADTSTTRIYQVTREN